MITPSKEFWNIFKKTEGALSCCEAIAIMNIALQTPNGRQLELGSYMGKSGMAALQGLKEADFYFIEPDFATGKIDAMNFMHRVNSATHHLGKSHLKFIGKYSIDVIPEYGDWGYVFVDSGSHQDGLPMQEVKLLEDRIISGGIIAFHDFNSQFVEVKGAYEYLLSTGKYEEVPINWGEIIAYVKEHDLENGNNSWHHTEMEFPCFVGALKRK